MSNKYFDWTKVMFPAGTKIIKREGMDKDLIRWTGKKLIVSDEIAPGNLAALKMRIRRTP